MNHARWPAPGASEREVLCGFLELQRGVVLSKARGVSIDVFVRTPMDSRTSIGGIVQHLAAVERYWFRRVLAGENWSYLGWETDDDADWLIASHATVDTVLDDYRAAMAESTTIAESFALTDPAKNITDGRGPVTLRWVLAHMIEETARHAGHLDVLREQADGTVGW